MSDEQISNKTDRGCLYVGLAIVGLIALVVTLIIWGLKGLGY